MKKRSFWTSVLLTLVCVLFAFAGCQPETPDKDKDKDKNPGKKPTTFNWSVSAVDGGGDALTTQLKISGVNSLDPSEITIGGTAQHNFNVNILTGKYEEGSITQSGSDWLVPITANATGNATVSIQKAGVTEGEQTVAVFGKFSLPEKTKPLNYKGKPAGYTGTTFVDPTYPQTSDMLYYVLDEETGEKIPNQAAGAAYEKSYMPLPLPNKAEGQSIPGSVKPAFYDNGGVNVAYSSAGLGANPASNAGHGTAQGYKGTFRRGTTVPRTSYIKGYFNNGVIARTDQYIVDMHGYGAIFVPEEWMNTLYCGWTADGQWWRTTVNVEETGIYEIKFLYTMQNGNPLKFSLDFDPEQTNVADVAPDTKVDCEVPSTNKPDPTDWRQAHHWNYCAVAYVYLEKGEGVMTTRLVNGGPNVSRFDFTLVG